MTPRLAVVIPAHDEEVGIAGALSALLDGVAPGALEVLVVANGCSDATADVARHAAGVWPDVRVLEVGWASKVAALRAGDAICRAWPRLYLDADVHCPGATALALAAALGPDVGLAVPERQLVLGPCTRLAASYHRTWASLPWVQAMPSGRGAYALTEDEHGRIGAFPDVVADDEWVARAVGPQRTRVVAGAPVIYMPARTLRTTVRVRARRIASARRLAVSPSSGNAATAAARRRWLLQALVRPSQWTYLLVQTVVVARVRLRSGAPLVWERDPDRGTPGSGLTTEAEVGSNAD